jgi:hypothetical protein
MAVKKNNQKTELPKPSLKETELLILVCELNWTFKQGSLTKPLDSIQFVKLKESNC